MISYRKTISADNPQDRKKISLLLSVIFLGISLIFIAVGIVIFSVNKYNQNKCTEEVTAKVIDLLATADSSVHNGRRSHDITYSPVFEYTYKDVKYVTKSKTSSNPPEYEIGETVKLMIDPDRPRKIFDPGSKVVSLLGFIFGGIGVLMLIIYIILIIAINRSQKKFTHEDSEISFYNENQ